MCKTSPDLVCFVCGKFCLNSKNVLERFPIRYPPILKAYKQYFGFAAANLSKPWTPNSVCATCHEIFEDISQGEERDFAFMKPMLWGPPTDHKTDCYFCLLKKPETAADFVYPNVQSVKKPELYPKKPIKFTKEKMDELVAELELSPKRRKILEGFFAKKNFLAYKYE